MTRSAARVITVTLLFGLGACTSAPQSRTDDPLVRGQTPVATPNPEPSAVPESTTAVPLVPDYPHDPAGYAREAVAAWVVGDQARLDQLEEPGGVLHRLAPARGFALANRCESASCLFRNGSGDELRLPIRGAALGGPLAVGAAGTLEPTSYPSDDRAYAAAALTAWVDRNDPRLRMLTRQQLTCAMVDALGAVRGHRWTFDHGEGGVGSVYLTWRDQTAHGLTFRFDNGPPAPSTGPPAQHRITEIIYEPLSGGAQ